MKIITFVFVMMIMAFVLIYIGNTKALSVGKVQDKTDSIVKNENIVFVGDSIFDWFPTEKIFSDFPIVNSGIGGNRTTDILENMEERIYKYNPTKVFIQIGTNDIEWEDSDELNEEVYQNIVKIAEGVKANRSQSEIYIISIYPVNNNLPGAHERHISEIKTINAKLKQYCASTEGVDYIDAFSQLVGDDGMLDIDYTDDGLHPNGLGYAKLTEILMKYIYE